MNFPLPFAADSPLWAVGWLVALCLSAALGVVVWAILERSSMKE